MSLRDQLAVKLAALPASPGVYLMKDGAGEVLYVGKAASLRQRVRSYFQKGASLSPRVRTMMERVQDLDYIVVNSEVEALILEANLIREYSPRYNVRLKDDKRYPYVRVGMNEPFPSLAIVRRPREDGARYFGPFAAPGALRETLTVLRRCFPIRTCRQEIPPEGKQGRPCLNYHIRRCSAPCAGLVGQEEYRRAVEQFCAALAGRAQQLLAALRAEMEEAAERLEFERAALLRDRIAALERSWTRQSVVSASDVDEDVIGLAVDRAHDLACAQVFQVREGRVTGQEHFFLEEVAEASLPQVASAFIKQYYAGSSYLPAQILLAEEPEEREALEEWLSLQAQGRGGSEPPAQGRPGADRPRVRIRSPARGEGRQRVELAGRNAELLLKEELARLAVAEGRAQEALSELKERLKLPRLPQRIEAYDISTIQGAEAVGSLVVFAGGRPRKSDYRRFRIRSVQGQNDFAMLEEVIRRRFARSEENPAQKPDLILVDGGKGQLNAVLSALRELGVEDVPAVGLAKEEEEIFLEGRSEPVVLPRDSQALHLLQHIRDEAHRFAVGYHRRLHRKESLRSLLDLIPGVGPQRKKALLRHFPSLQALRRATVEELALVPGISRRLAEEIAAFLRSAE
ncbi:MAG: excinuclease ABC subunit UvrC [Bacillota bacterium]|nr:excinuclease ABC subunit UvrC [Bacillota bacterium]